MCLITEQKEPIITTEDLVVYKQCDHINNKLRSKYFRNFVYEKNVLNTTCIERIHERRNIKHYDSLVFNYYDGVAEQHNIYNDYIEAVLQNLLIAIGPGFHFAKTIARLDIYPGDLKAYRFIIPKGSEVYYDATGLGVANQIIYSPEE